MEPKELSIMVIEDEELLLRAITKKITSEGLSVVSCTSARQAIDYLKHLSDLPNAIWLDYYLGEDNGLTFMEEVSKNVEWAKIPVFVVSNSASEQKKNAMMALGAKSYLLKAENKLEDIINVIKGYLDTAAGSS